MKTRHTAGGDRSSPWMPVLLSMLAMCLAMVLNPALTRLEEVTADLRMSWRYRLLGERRRDLVSRELAVLCIDRKTQEVAGRYGAGQWLSRQPFFNQLAFFEQHLRPSVLAYDLVFQETLDRLGEVRRVSESPQVLGAMASDIRSLAEAAAEVLPRRTLNAMTRFSAEQGNVFFAHRLASVMEKGAFDVVLGYNFRGGAVDPQRGRVPSWSDSDVFGDDPDGDESYGRRVPYLKDVAIPETDVHFAPGRGPEDYGYSPNANLPGSDLLDYCLLGFLNSGTQAGSVVRRVPLVLGFSYQNRLTGRNRRVFVPSFALLACLLHLGLDFPLAEGAVEVHFGDRVVVRPPHRDPLTIPIDRDGFLYLNFNAGFTDFEGGRFADACLPPGPPHDATLPERVGRLRPALQDRIVLVGLVLTGLDVGACPIAANTPLVHVHLTAANNILTQCFLTPLGPGGLALVLALWFVCYTGVCVAVRTWHLGLVTLGLLFGYLAVSYAGVHWNWTILPTVGPILYVALASLLVTSYRFFTEELERRRIRKMFSTMVSDKVLSFLEENPESFSLQGHNAEATVFFSDVADFTTISEHLPPERLTRLLNAYLTPITDCILGRDGYVDKYVGDGVMAVWGAPYPDPEHAYKACAAALAQQDLVAELNADLEKEYGVSLRVRTGISSGVVTAGNMGSQRKLQYTVMGDVVNLAFRLEPANKDFGTRLMIAEATARQVGSLLVVRELGRIRVRGKRQAVTTYELVGTPGSVGPESLRTCRRYEECLRSFYAREWDACLSGLDELSEDGPARKLRELALQCRQAPPGPDWQGEYVRSEKY